MEHTILGLINVSYELAPDQHHLPGNNNTHYQQHQITITADGNYAINYIQAIDQRLGFFLINSPSIMSSSTEATLDDQSSQEKLKWQSGDIILDGVLVAQLQPEQLSVRVMEAAKTLILPLLVRGVTFLLPDLAVALYRSLEPTTKEIIEMKDRYLQGK